MKKGGGRGVGNLPGRGRRAGVAVEQVVHAFKAGGKAFPPCPLRR